MHVLDVAHDERNRLVVTVETDADVGGCPSCGVVAVGHGRRFHVAADAPCFGAVTVVRWRKRVWRCAEPACPVGTFSERHELIAPRARLTSRCVSENVPTGHAGSAHRQIRLRQTPTVQSAKQGASATR